VGSIKRAFDGLIATESGEERLWLEQARVVFIMVMGTGLRRGELRGLRWRHIYPANPDGARLRVVETFVGGFTDRPKSAAGERTLALGKRVADELFQHRASTAYGGDDEFVFCSPTKGTPFDPRRYAISFRKALAAGINDYIRPFYDMRHSSITNSAAAGTSTTALMARAGHADLRTTQGYVDLAGESCRAEAERLEERLWGHALVESSGTPETDPDEASPETLSQLSS
jgi:integrase